MTGRTRSNLKCCGWSLLGFVVLMLFMYGGLPWEQGRVRHNEPEPLPEDDLITDKHPEYDPRLTALVQYHGYGHSVANRSAAVTGLDVADLLPDEKQSYGGLYPDFATALAAIPRTRDRELGTERPNALPSVDMLDAYTKYTDDRLLGAVETALSTGPAVFPGGRQGFLRELAVEVIARPSTPARDEAAVFLLAAWELGGGDDAQLTGPFRAQIDTQLAAFEEYPEFSKPVGIYTGSEEFKRIFRRDRFLQQPFGALELDGPDTGRCYPTRSLAAAVCIAEALDQRPDFWQAYLAYLALAAGLTNPTTNLNMDDLLNYRQHFGNTTALARALKQSTELDRVSDAGNTGGDRLGIALWPFATSKEGRLFARIYDGELPTGDVMDDLTAAIESGALDLAPTPDSGWYDYQLYALETLLLPGRAREADKLLLTGRYKDRLKKAFKAMLTLRRELHIKEMPLMKSKGGPRIPPKPQLTVEPAPTNYLRTARAYLKLRRVLETAFGDDMAEVRTDAETGLLDELDAAILHFVGLHIISCEDLGMIPDFPAAEFAEVITVEYPLDAKTLERRFAPGGLFDVDSLPACITQDLSPVDASLISTAFSETRQWLAGFHLHPALAADPRVMVPVLANADGTRVRYWAVTGVTFKRLKAWYAVPPACSFHVPNNATPVQAGEYLRDNPDSAEIDWEPVTTLIPVYSFAEVEMGPEPLSREEFQALCDRYGDQESIVAALEGRSVSRSRARQLLPWVIAVVVLVAAVIIVLRRKRVGLEGSRE